MMQCRETQIVSWDSQCPREKEAGKARVSTPICVSGSAEP